MEGAWRTDQAKSHETVYLKDRKYTERKLTRVMEDVELTRAKSHETVYLKDRMEEACGNICRKEAHKQPGELSNAKSHETVYLKD